MSKFNSMLESKVMPIAGKMAGQRHLQALRDGIVLTMPLIIIGSVFLILSNLPIPGYNDFMAGIFGKEWATKMARYAVCLYKYIVQVKWGFYDSLKSKDTLKEYKIHK